MVTQQKSGRMPLDRDDESGRYTQSYTPEMVVETLEENNGAASTREVADGVGCSRRLALRRLRELEEDGRVTAREVGNTYLWVLQDDEDGE